MESSIGPYRLLRKISRGGMGSVYEAIHTTIERRVAIKVLDAASARSGDLTTRFLNEARAVNRVNDPGLVQMFDHGLLRDGRAYIVMEYLEGETLSRRLRRLHRRMPLADILRFLRQTAETLTATHEKGIIHRDLKPDNIMLVRDPAVAGGERTKVLDFGIAKLRESVPTKGSNTHKDLLMGTPSYMSPEQCRGAGGVDEKTDVYSLGVVLYRALAGRPPFVAAGAGDTMAQHIYQEPPALAEKCPWLPASLTSFVHLLLSKEPSQRPSMAEVAARLAGLGSELADFVPPSAVAESSQSGVRPAEDSSDELSGPHQTAEGDHDSDGGGEHDEDEVLETIAVSESAQSLHPPGSAIALSARSQSAPSLLGWSISDTGQGTLPARSASRWLWPSAVLALLLLGGGLWGLRSAGRSRQPTDSPGQLGLSAKGTTGAAVTVTQAPAAPATPAAVAASHITWTIETAPAGAEIVRVSDGQVLGQTPWHTELPAGQGVEEVRLRLAGHFERLLGLPRHASSQSSLTLMPIASGPAGKSSEPKSQGPSKNSSKNPKRGHVKIVLED